MLACPGENDVEELANARVGGLREAVEIYVLASFAVAPQR